MALIRNQISLSIILIKVSKAIFLIFVRFELFFSYVRNIVKSIVNTNRDDRRVRRNFLTKLVRSYIFTCRNDNFERR